MWSCVGRDYCPPTALILSFGGYYVTASVFSLSAFGMIGVISFLQTSKEPKSKVFHKNFAPKNRGHNHKARNNN